MSLKFFFKKNAVHSFWLEQLSSIIGQHDKQGGKEENFSKHVPYEFVKTWSYSFGYISSRRVVVLTAIECQPGLEGEFTLFREKSPMNLTREVHDLTR